MKARHWINATLLAATTAGLVAPRAAWSQDTPPVATPATAPAMSLDEGVRADVNGLIQLLNDPVATQAQHDEAARRLVERTSNATARQELARVLGDRTNVRGQLAVATVVSELDGADPTYVELLIPLLGTDSRLSAVAAKGLATYKSNPSALDALISFAKTSPTGPTAKQLEPIRIATIEAIGSMLDKRAAETLIGLLRSDLESESIRTAAASALSAMTGRSDVGRDRQQWDAWWATAEARSDGDFRNDLLNARATKADQTSRVARDLSTRLREALNEQFTATPREGRAALLVRHLNDENPVVRSLGAGLVVDEARNANFPSAATRDRLRAMVGDSDSKVRVDVATALRSLNDTAAVDALRVQLAQETSTDAMLAQIAALGTTADPRAVPSILPLVDHPSDIIAMAAVRALGPLGRAVRQSDPTATATLREKLVEVIRGRAAKAGSEPLKAAAVTALAPVADPSTTPLLITLLGQREATAVRVAACNTIGAVRDPKAGDRLVDLFDPRTTERDVRLAAVRAMGELNSFEYAPALLGRMREADEPDEDIRAAAAASIDRILPSGNKRNLKELADRFRNDPNRRLAILRELVAKLKQSNDPDLPIEQLNLGETEVAVGQFREAAVSFKSALDQMLAADAPNAQVERLIQQYIVALLRSGQFAEGASFATTIIQGDVANVQTVGQQVVSEAKRLRQAGELESSLRLVSAFKNLRLQRYNLDLAELEVEMQQELNRKTNTRPTGNAFAPELHPFHNYFDSRIA